MAVFVCPVDLGLVDQTDYTKLMRFALHNMTTATELLITIPSYAAGSLVPPLPSSEGGSGQFLRSTGTGSAPDWADAVIAANPLVANRVVLGSAAGSIDTDEDLTWTPASNTLNTPNLVASTSVTTYSLNAVCYDGDVVTHDDEIVFA